MASPPSRWIFLCRIWSYWRLGAIELYQVAQSHLVHRAAVRRDEWTSKCCRVYYCCCDLVCSFFYPCAGVICLVCYGEALILFQAVRWTIIINFCFRDFPLRTRLYLIYLGTPQWPPLWRKHGMIWNVTPGDCRLVGNYFRGIAQNSYIYLQFLFDPYFASQWPLFIQAMKDVRVRASDEKRSQVWPIASKQEINRGLCPSRAWRKVWPKNWYEIHNRFWLWYCENWENISENLH